MVGEVLAQPLISSVSPSRNAVNVASDANINIWFNETMDDATLNENTIFVFGSYRGAYTGLFSYSGTNLVFNPDKDFLPGEVITVTVTTDAKNTSDVALERSYTYSFTAATQGFGLFDEPITFAAVPSSQATDVVAADFSGDGNIDLAVLSQGNNTISVHFSNGDGTFETPVVLENRSGAIAMKLEAADVNGNGYPDLLVANISAYSLSVFLNNGDNSFEAREDYATSATLPATDMVVMDIAGNGILDVVQLHYGTPIQYLFHYMNDGTGDFGTGSQITIADIPTGGSLALSYHGANTMLYNSLYQWRPHLLVTDYTNEQLRVYENDGSGTGYAQLTPFSTGTNPVAVGGFRLYTNSPIADAVVLNSGSDNMTVYTAPEVWSGDSFTSQSDFPVGDSPVSVAGGDLNGNGTIDLMIVNGGDGSISYMPNTTGTFLENISYNVGANVSQVVLADMNGNGRLDIVTANTNGTVSILYNYPGPELLSTNPANAAKNIGTEDAIELNFSINGVDATTLNSSTIKVLGSQTGIVAADYSFAGNTLTITPDSPLKPGERVTVIVTSGVESTLGHPLANPASFSFDVAGGEGGGILVAQTNYSTGNEPNDVLLVDFDGDGHIDVVTANKADNNISVFISDGSGGFAAPVNYAAGTEPVALAAGDVNGNGNIDLVSVGNESFARVFSGNGDGTFAASTTVAIADAATAVTLVDFNYDGSLDLLYNSNSQLRSQTNDGSGSFSNEFNYSSATGNIVTADVNNDGITSFIYFNATNIRVTTHNGATLNTDSYPVSNPKDVIAADFNANGYVDIAAVTSGGNLVLFANNEDGTFASGVSTSLGGGAGTRLVAKDIDGDGDLDIAVTKQGNDETVVLLNDGNGAFTLDQTLTVTTPQAIAAADMNSNGIVDLVVTNIDSNEFAVITNSQYLQVTGVNPSPYEFLHPVNQDVSITFSEAINLSSLDDGISVKGSVQGTYEGTWSGTTTVNFSPSTDFLPGEVITVTVTKNVTSAIGAPVEFPYEFSFTANSNPLGSYLAGQEFSTAVGISDFFIADMTNNNNPDVVAVGNDWQADEFYIKVMTSDGLGNLVSTVSTTITPFFLRTALVSDFNNDGNMDVAILESHVDSGGGGEGEFSMSSGPGESSVTIFPGNGDGTFGSPVQTSISNDYEIENFASGDLNGNGNTDLVLTREDGNDVIALLGQGDGTFTEQSPIAVPNGPYVLTLADINLDGRLDIITGNLNTSEVSILEGNGDGTFGSPSTVGLNFDPYQIIVQDLNNDGYPDLLVGDGDEQVEILLNNGMGGFSSAQILTANWSFEVVDFNGDAYPDLVFNSSNGISIYTNNEDGTFSTSPKAFSGSFVSYMKVLDMTGNGSADIVTRTNSNVSIYENVEPVFVTSHTPASNTLDVDVSTPITVTFNSDMNATTLDAASIQVTSSFRGKLAGAYSYDAGTKTATFTPTDSYLAGEVISVNVTKDAESSGGVPIESGKFFSFTAEADGYGFFEPELGMSLSSPVSKTVGADMTGNGVTDLVAASFSDIKVYQNDGTGGLTEISSLSISSLSNFWVHDFNQDGYPDVYAKRSSDNNIYFFINDGAGGFVETDYTLVNNAYLNANVFSYDLAFADLTGNGLEEAVYTSQSFSNVQVRARTGDFTFGNSTTIGSDGGYALKVSDVNNDGIPDLIWSGGDSNSGVVNIAIGQGGGSFGSVITRDVGARPEALVVADLTGNGYPDIATADRNGESFSVILNSAGSFGQAAIYNTSGFAPEAIFSSDVDGDGDLDLLISGDDDAEGLPKVLVAYNDGNGGFGNQIFFANEYDEPYYYEAPQNISLLDLDGDGRLDIAGYARGNDGGTPLHNLAFLKNASSGSSTAPTVAASNPSTSDISFSSATVSWTNGDGLRRLVIVKEGSAVDATLTDDAGYNANPSFGSGTEIGTGNYVVYGGTGSSVTVTGLDSETDYHFAIYEINGIPGQEKILTAGAPTGSFTTSTAPLIFRISDASTTFSKADNADWTNDANQDRITDYVWITRKDIQGVFNYYSESGFVKNSSPAGTLWSFGTADDIPNLTFENWRSATGNCGQCVLDDPMVMYLVHHNTYVEVEFTSFTGDESGGGFTYTRGDGVFPDVPAVTFDPDAGYALSFDGENDRIYFDAYDFDINNMPDPVTFEMWVKPTGFPESDKMVFASGDDESHQIGINEDRQFYTAFYDDEEDDLITVTGTTIANENQWYHIAASAKSDGEVKLYVNGILEASDEIIEVYTDIDEFYFGYEAYDGDYYFQGVLDEIRIWRVERTITEIRSNMYSADSGANGANAFAVWQFNEGSGNIANDPVNDYNIEIDADGSSRTPTWVVSDIPTGGVSEVSSGVQSGTETVGNATLNITTPFDNPVDVFFNEITTAPNQFPSGFSASLGGKYFVIDLVGDPGTFSVDLTLNFGPEAVDEDYESNPSLLKLYRRTSNSGGEWDEIASATTAVASTGEVTWTGITSFSEFIVMEDEPEPSIGLVEAGVTLRNSDDPLNFTFTAEFLEVAEGLESEVFTVVLDDEIEGLLFIDEDEDGEYDDEVDTVVGTETPVNYTPNSDKALVYIPDGMGMETLNLTFNYDEDDFEVTVNIFTIQGTAELAGNEDENSWQLLSKPLNIPLSEMFEDIWTQGAVNSDAPGGTATLYLFNQDNGAYEAITDDLEETTVDPGSGILAYVFAFDDYVEGIPEGGGWPKLLEPAGNAFHQETFEIEVKNVDLDGNEVTSGNEGFVLLGNPFAWPLAVDSVVTRLKDLDPLANSYVYRWNPVAENYELAVSGSIKPYESVFVRLVTSGTTETLVLNHDDIYSASTMTKPATPDMVTFNLSHIESGIESSTYLRFSEEASTGIDPYDGYYLGTYASTYANLYTLLGDQALVINNLPTDKHVDHEYPIYMHSSVAGEFTLNWDSSMLPEGWEFILTETATGTNVNLLEQDSFTFESEQNMMVAAENMKVAAQKVEVAAKSTHLPAKAKGTSIQVDSESQSAENHPLFTLHIQSDQVGTDLSEVADIPREVELHQNFPNPFNPTSVIRYGVPEAAEVRLEVFDILGRRVMVLVNNELKNPGRYNVQFNASSLSSGVYIYRLVVGDNVMTKKMTLIK